jgi:hypothetical protein
MGKTRKPKALSRKRKKLLTKLERIVGGNCFNGNIQNYYMWEWENEGRWFRYPITFVDKNGKKRKERYPEDSMASAKMQTGYYAFGANQLHIMRGLVEVIDYLEAHHDLKVE